MIKLGVNGSSSNSEGYTRYIGDGGTYDPQLQLADYLGRLGLQKKTQADDLFGGNENAKNLGFGLFDMKMFGSGGGNDDPGPDTTDPGPDENGPGAGPGLTEDDPQQPIGVRPRKSPAPPLFPPPTGGGGAGGGGGVGGGNGDPGPGGPTGGGKPIFQPIEPVNFQQTVPNQNGATPEQLLSQWTAARRR